MARAPRLQGEHLLLRVWVAAAAHSRASSTCHGYGFKVLPYGPYFQPYPDGRSLTISSDSARTRASIAQFSRRDADAYDRFEAWLGGIADVVWPLFTQVPPRIGSLRPADLLGTMKVAWRARGLGVRGVADLTRLFSSSINDLLDDWFESDELRERLRTRRPSAPGPAPARRARLTCCCTWKWVIPAMATSAAGASCAAAPAALRPPAVPPRKPAEPRSARARRRARS